MDKFQIYHTGIDAVIFLLSNRVSLSLTRENALALGEVFERISKRMSDCVFDLTEVKDETQVAH